MRPLIATGSGALLVAGVILLVVGLGRRIPDVPVSRPWTAWLVVRQRVMGARRRLWVVFCVGAGAVTGIWTGRLAVVVLTPSVLLGIPHLLSEPLNPEVEILVALDRWLRFLGPSMATGKSTWDTIITIQGQVPQVLTALVVRAVARLDLGWTIRDAPIVMAGESKSADADGVLTVLAIASSRDGIDARTMLVALTENTQMRLRTLREIVVERAKPRVAVRQTVDTTLATFIVVRWLPSGCFALHGILTGQLLALALITLYVGALLILRCRTLSEPAVRFLRGN